jgi:hypothetical protein
MVGTALARLCPPYRLLKQTPPAALLERIGIAPRTILLNPGHLLRPFAMLGQYRRSRAIDDVAPDQPGPDSSVP